MTLKHLFTVLTMACCTLLGFTACNDEDYAPIQLQTVSGEGKLDHNVLQLNAFSQGESFLILGGNGRYVIENKNNEIIDFRYDGQSLTIVPVGVGTGTIIITDHAGNKMTLTIEVTNPTTSFKIMTVESQAYGDNMTGLQMETLKKQILDDALIKVGGDIQLTYTNKEYTFGSVTIHPTPSSRPIVGTFKQNNDFSTSNVPYQKIEIRLADNRSIVWYLLNYSDEENAKMLLQENVTDTYKNEYSNLEKATLTYTITH